MKNNFSPETVRLAVNTIRMLAVDGVQKAESGHPGMPMGAAECAFVLWSRSMRYYPEDPEWMNRDRFVLSAGHGSMLLYALLHLAGYDVSSDDLRMFRQWESRTPGHPEYGCLPGVETTTGPLGQGFANGIGMALASRILGDRFNTADFNPIDHRIFGIVSDGDLMEGVASEAASLAGYFQLGNIIYIYDDNHITIEGDTALTYSEDVARRFDACGWHTQCIDGQHIDQIDEAVQSAKEEKTKPSLILARTHIGFGSPGKQDCAGAHGAPLGEEEVLKTKRNLGWPEKPEFHVPEEVRTLFRQRKENLRREYESWQEHFKRWKHKHPDLAETWNLMISKTLPDQFESDLIGKLNGGAGATRIFSGKILQMLSESIPGLIGGSADLAPSTKTLIEGSESIGPGSYHGKNIHFGIREHAMGSILNGMALYGGIIPYGSTFLVFSDYMRPPMRLAALMGLQVIYIFTHDSLFVGEDGPTHQPVEHLTVLRAIPNLNVIRPADELETAMAWLQALERKNGPTAICLTRQNVPVLNRPDDFDRSLIQYGGYILADENRNPPDAVLVATGSEVALVLENKARLLEKGVDVRVVSMPCYDVFLEQSSEYRSRVVPETVPVVVVEAGVTRCWYGLTRSPMLVIGMDRFGASAPASVLAEKFGFTMEGVFEMVSCWLKDLKDQT